MADQLHVPQAAAFGLDRGQRAVDAFQRVGADVLVAVAVEFEQHVGHQRAHGLRRGREGIALARRRLGIVDQVFGDLDVGLGMAPLLLVELVAGMHQLDFATGRLLLRAHEAGRSLQRTQALPQVITQVLCVVHQRGVHGQRRLPGFHAGDQLLRFGQRLLREVTAVIAGVFVEGHIQPALRLGQMVVAHRAATVVQCLDAALGALIRLQVGMDGLVGDALCRCGQRGLRRCAASQCQQCGCGKRAAACVEGAKGNKREGGTDHGRCPQRAGSR